MAENPSITNLSVLRVLAERCERDEPCRILDWAIFDEIKQKIGTGAYGNHPAYTTSLDAAMTLMPDGIEWNITNLYGVAQAEAGLNFSNGNWQTGRHKGGHMALALCAAALRARAALADGDA